jgi:hypothetical protein
VNAAGSVIAAAGLAPLLVASDLRLRRAGFVAWVVGCALLAASLLSHTITHVRVTLTGRPLLGLAAVVIGVGALVAGGYVAHRSPALVLWAAVAAAPARIPVTVGGSSANLLLPLYLVIACIAAAAAYELAIGRDEPPAAGWIGWTLAAFVGISALSMTWTVDGYRGGVAMLFFYLPFAFLAARLSRLHPGRRELTGAVAIQVGLGVLFALVAFGQELTHHIFWNPNIKVGNLFRSFFRVNSLFWDASVYGRFMAVTLVVLAGIAVYRRLSPGLAVLMLGLFAAMYFSYSQSAMVALAAGALVLGGGIWPRRVIAGLAGAAAVVAVVGLAGALHGNNANRVTSDRAHLIRLGWRVVRHHPLDGAGLGGFQRAAMAGTAHPFHLANAASHTTPVTVIAELGPVGLALYVALLAAVLLTAARGAAPPGVRVTLAAAFVAIFASSLFYNSFFEDPATWICMALLASLAVTAPSHQGIGGRTWPATTETPSARSS